MSSGLRSRATLPFRGACTAAGLAWCMLAWPAFVAHGQVGIDESRRTAIVNAIERAAPSVVTINVVDVQRQRVVDPLFDRFFGPFSRGIPRTRVRERAVESIGSGFLVDDRGHIVTNYHVLEAADAITSVHLPDGRDLDVEFVGADERSDLAVLRARGDDLPFATLGTSEDLLIGEWVIAIGNPFGNMMRDPQPSVSVGVVSAARRRVSREVGGGDRLYQDLIQTDAAINPGNSGGPLVNAQGDVVGVNTMIFSRTGGNQGLGFAIPIDRVRRVADEIIRFGRRRNPWMGFRGEAVSEISPYSLTELGISANTGVLVTEIVRRAPAAREGLQPGDVITAINGLPVSEPLDIDLETWKLFVGDVVELEIDRNGRPLTLEFAIAEIDAV